MIAVTSYSRGDAGGMQRYMKSDKETKVEVKNSKGEEITRQERADFTRKCNDNEMWRHVAFSPDPKADWSGEEIDIGVRKTMSKLKEDRQSLEYQYAVHDTSDASRRSGGKPHAHVIMTGKSEDLEMWEDQGDLKEMSDTAAEEFRESDKMEVKMEENSLTESLDETFENTAEMTNEVDE